MRTKALLGLAALAVSAATCVAQSNVYSLNIVGYVNVPVQAGLNLISNPLKPSDGNYNITNTIILPDSAEGALLYKWGGTGWSSDIPEWITDFGWFSQGDVNINLGEAFFLKSPVATQITFVGEVATGDVPYSLPTGTSLVASKTPVAESWPGEDVGNEGDLIYTWTGSAWSAPWEYVADYGWFSGTAEDPVDGPVLNVGSGVIYQNKGDAFQWTRSFNP